MTRPIPPELLVRIHKHERWLETFEKEGQQFTQQWVDLRDIDLSGQDLARVALSHVRLDRALLCAANLNDAILYEGSFVQTILDDTQLIEADVTQSNFSKLSYGTVLMLKNECKPMTNISSPPPTDLYRIDALLTEEERMVRDTVRKFVAERVLPIIGKHFEAGTFPRELVPEMAELGLLGMHLDGYGCSGMSAVCYGLACQELEAGDSGVRSFVSVQGSLAMFPIWAFGSEEQKLRWLPRMAQGEVIGCFGLTEPDSGSDPASMRTTARLDGSRYVLNGTKMWITNGGIADIAIVWARADDGVRGFIVERGTPGFTTSDIHQKLSLRASVTSELHLEDCRVSVENMLPHVRGMRGPLSCLDEARYGIAWGATGVARACYETALQYALTRVQFQKPIASFQLVQQKLVNMVTELVKAQLLALQLGRLKDSGQLHAVQVSVAKRNNVREALKTAREARSILGANGITLEYPISRHMNNLESVFTYEGTDDVHTLIIGQAITGQNAFTS